MEAFGLPLLNKFLPLFLFSLPYNKRKRQPNFLFFTQIFPTYLSAKSSPFPNVRGKKKPLVSLPSFCYLKKKQLQTTLPSSSFIDSFANP